MPKRYARLLSRSKGKLHLELQLGYSAVKLRNKPDSEALRIMRLCASKFRGKVARET